VLPYPLHPPPGSQDFDIFWKAEGEQLLTWKKGAVASDDPVMGPHADEDDYAEDDQVEGVETADAEQAAAAHERLMAAEDHAAIKKEIEELLAHPEAEPQPLQASSHAEPPPQQASTASELLPLQASTASELLPLQASECSLRALMDKCSQQVFQTDTEPGAVDECLQRLQLLRPVIRDFILDVRLRENILSSAMVTGKCKYAQSEHRNWEHELALARAASGGSGERENRQRAWRQLQERLAAPPPGHADPSSWPLKDLLRLHPPFADKDDASKTNYQA
jgi:hypothetical protein